MVPTSDVMLYEPYGSGSTPVSHCCRRFITEKLPPVQFKNPNVQVLMFKNTKPTPVINIYFGEHLLPLPFTTRPRIILIPNTGDGKKVMLDVENKTADSILKEISAVAAKSE